MGRDRMRVLVCAAATIALILAGSLAMDWFRLTVPAIDSGAGRASIDLRNIQLCNVDHGCTTTSITPLHGMFPTLAALTLWSSLGFAALVVFQAGARLLTGAANDAFTKLGYVLALLAISFTVATAYMFGPDADGPINLVTKLGGALPRTWAPLTLLAGLVAGFATVYMAVAPASSDLGATYKPVTLTPVPGAPPGTSPAIARAKTGSIPLPVAAGAPDAARPPGSDRIPLARPRTDPATTGVERSDARTPTSIPRAGVTSERTPISVPRAGVTSERTPTSVPRAGLASERTPINVPRVGLASEGTPTSIPRAGLASERTPIHLPRAGTGSNPGIRPPTEPPLAARTRSGPLPPVPAHLRGRLQYVAITAELTAGGIDAHLEDGSSRLVLWRDVVGVVARRLPLAFDGATFIDVVSTAGSTLRIVPWTRLTGEPIDGEPDARPRGVVERVIARCPDARVDPATRQFLDTGEAAQLPDVETLRAHDERLA
ncbi:MAG TPA: hypothetical protein VFK02_29480 [Kofleriaceae bacterium]|nr:hypothetical protein [Kofleriaceae bacterium]